MFAGEVLFVKMLGDGLGLGICGDSLKGHPRNFFEYDGHVRSLRGRFAPAKRSVTGHEHSRRVERVHFFQACDDDVTCVGFVF